MIAAPKLLLSVNLFTTSSGFYYTMCQSYIYVQNLLSIIKLVQTKNITDQN